MFYYKRGLIRRVRLHPQYIKPRSDMSYMVKKKLAQDIKENRFTLNDGYVIKIICTTEIGKGVCLPLVGFVEYTVEFEALVLYPIIGEVIFAEVMDVQETSVIFNYSGVFGVIRSYSLDEEYKFETTDGSGDEEHDLHVLKEGLFRSQVHSEKVIRKGRIIKVRLLRRTLGANGFFLIGSMHGDFLGPVPAVSIPELPSASITDDKLPEGNSEPETLESTVDPTSNPQDLPMEAETVD